MLRLTQASATTVHRTERALQRQARPNKNLGSRSVNSTTQDPDMSPTRGRHLCGSCHGVASRGRPSARCWRVSLWVRPATSSSPVRWSSAVRRAALDGARAPANRASGIVDVTGFHGRPHRTKVGHSGRFSISNPAGRYPTMDRIPRLGWKRGECYVDSTSPPARIDVVAGSKTRITLDCHGH